MKICILSSIIMVFLTNDSCADEQTNQNDLITTYDPGETTSETPILPSFPSYGQIKADDQPDHHPEQRSQIRFEDQSSERPPKFEDDHKGHGYVGNDKADAGLLLADVSFDDEKSSFEGKSDNHNTGNKISFEGSNDEPEISDDQTSDDPQSRRNQVVFEDDGKSVENDSEYPHESETEIETNKQIKFENQDDETNFHTKNRDSNRHPVTFIDNSDKNPETNRMKKKKPRRKPRYQANLTNPAPIASNSPYPGLGYPGYPGVSKPGPGYPGPGDPNAAYPGYPTPGYPAPGNPYPNYPNSFPGTAFPAPNYPGYSPYPTMHPPMGPGDGKFPAPGYQVPEDQRPLTNPIAYPHPVLGNQSGDTDTRPSQDYAGTPSSGGTQSGQPGSLYPGPEYPYYQGYPMSGYPQVYPGEANSQYPVQSQVQYRPPGYPGFYQQGYQRPFRRPKSLTQRAVSAVAEALTSIAMYDDYQCVPRILCEVAEGSTASSSTLLKASASLQPLLTLLQAYNGVSSSPLFIFGRAAVTGVTAKGNPLACHRAYPQCPRDPEKLINYLNNHNGGFFRFFGQPAVPQQPQNLEQFYNYLSGQYGFQQQPQQNYGYLRPYGYGFQAQNPPGSSQNYGQNYYQEQIGYRNPKNNESEAEERIQNKPGVYVLEDEEDLGSNDNQEKDSKWSFPDKINTIKGNEREKVKITKHPERPTQPEILQQLERPRRVSKTLKFPDDRSDRKERKQKNILFPGESHFKINSHYQTSTPVNPEEYVFDHKHNFYVKKSKDIKYDEVVYVVRGNGDPNHPEIVKISTGQSI